MEKNTITHVRYDENGNVIERYEVPVAPSNVTDTEINITEDLLRGMAKRGRKNDTMQADYSNIGKTVYFKTDAGKRRQVTAMECKHLGTAYEIVFNQPNNKKIEVVLPVK